MGSAKGVLVALGFIYAISSASAERLPNIVLIVSDDAGFSDFGFQGSETILTPHVDEIARQGVRMAAGYVTASICSPSRAALLTGRYQQRFGHEFNMLKEISPQAGLPLSEMTLAERLRAANYDTIAIGKWHLGYADQFHPQRRGFHEFYGFLEGWRGYWPGERHPFHCLKRNASRVEEHFEYLTDELGDAAVQYLEQHFGKSGRKPFFLYLAYNAPHGPMDAKPALLEKFSAIPDERRRAYVAMTVSLDESVGKVLETLKSHGAEDETLLFFINDNGGATDNASDNAPLRGHKGTLYEGGVRVPFLIRWTDRLRGGITYEHAVSALDVVPTVLAAAGIAQRPDDHLDGVDLMPYLTSDNPGLPHETLYWRCGTDWAIRDGDWKLVSHGKVPAQLFNINEDQAESKDLADVHADYVQSLKKKYATWNSEMAEPRWQLPWPTK